MSRNYCKIFIWKLRKICTFIKKKLIKHFSALNSSGRLIARRIICWKWNSLMSKMIMCLLIKLKWLLALGGNSIGMSADWFLISCLHTADNLTATQQKRSERKNACVCVCVFAAYPASSLARHPLHQWTRTSVEKTQTVHVISAVCGDQRGNRNGRKLFHCDCS